MAADVATASVPTSGVWRVARADNPLWAPTPKASALRSKAAGNRYDVPGLMTLYFSTTLVGCYTEVLAGMRPSPQLAELVEAEWQALNHLAPGQLSASWRHRRSEVRVKISPQYSFLDVERTATLDLLDVELRPALAAIGYKQLDFGLLHGPDRRVTQLIARWASEALADPDDEEAGYRFAGIRYASRLDQNEMCWAVWADGLDLEEIERRAVERESVDLANVSQRFKLRTF